MTDEGISTRLVVLVSAVLVAAACSGSTTSTPTSPAELGSSEIGSTSQDSSATVIGNEEPGDQSGSGPNWNGPADEVDFDSLYPALDAARSEAWGQLDLEAMAAVSSDQRILASIEAETSGARDAWDRSGLSYDVQSVEVFDVVDDDNVLLHIVDIQNGQSVRRDSSGAIVESGPVRDDPEATYIIWMLRGEDDQWRIAEDYRVDPTFPPSLDDFELGPTADVDGRPLELWFNNNDSGVCYVLYYEGAVPIPHCNEVKVRLATHQAEFRYHLEQTEEYEAFVVVSRRASSFYLKLEVDGVEVPIKHEINADRVLALWADVPDRASELAFGAVNEADEIDPADFVLADSRQQRRDYFAGVLSE